MMRIRVAASVGFVATVLLAAPARADTAALGKNAKYSFKVVEVTGDVDEATKAMGKDLLEAELGSRPEFTHAAPNVEAPTAGAAPARTGLRAFQVSLKFEELKKDLKEPRPGGRLKQLAVSARLGIYGAEMPTQKLAFSGDGEAMVEAEIIERKLAEEAKPLVRDVISRAVKEAVDQAVLKLSLPKADPVSAKRKKHKA